MLFGLCIFDTLGIDGRLDSIVVIGSRDRPLLADHIRDVGPSLGSEVDVGPLRLYTDEYGLSVQTALSVLRPPLFQHDNGRLTFEINHAHLSLEGGQAGIYMLLLPSDFIGAVHVKHTDDRANICSSASDRRSYELRCDHSEVVYLTDSQQLLLYLSFLDNRVLRSPGSDPFVRVSGQLAQEPQAPRGVRTSTLMEVFSTPFPGFHFSPVDKLLKAIHFKNVSAPTASVFLCHSSADKAHARRLAVALATRGIRVWLDEAEIRIGDSLVEKIEHGIEATSCLAPLLSKNSVSSRWCQEELRMALASQIASGSRRVLPVLLDDCKIPGFLLEKAYADLREGALYDREIDRLAADIKYRASEA